jgi:membrane protease YdiL (CAAX protease family)
MQRFASVMPGAQWLLAVATPGSWLRALSASVSVAGVLAVPAFVLLRFATARGLEGSFGSARPAVGGSAFRRTGRAPGRWLRDPLLHKEWLWLKRDRTALIQLIGLPLLIVSPQLFNLQNMLRNVELTWNRLAGVIVGIGGYMLFVSGPRALMSEGPALALTMSWPRSLEDSLRIKVRLLFALVSAMVWLALGATAWMFPGDIVPLLLVAIAWIAFGLSVAEKAVTLIRQPSQSGEPEPLPQSQQWVASLGNLTFAIAIFTARWPLAIAAIAMNWAFAGALWQGFRLRLTYLFDPDSQPALIPPTILSSLIAVVGLLEFGAVFGVAIAVLLGSDGNAYALAMGYGAAAVIVGPVALVWHARHGVGIGDLVRMDGASSAAPPFACMATAVGGVALGGLGVAWHALLLTMPWPELHSSLEQGTKIFLESPDLRLAYAIMAIAIAPWIEEFIFRGLMFRAMLPQWGLWRAAFASAAFFAVLHPALAWPPVFMLGIVSALLFARSRALLPCIVLHACYNAVVVAFST